MMLRSPRVPVLVVSLLILLMVGVGVVFTVSVVDRAGSTRTSVTIVSPPVASISPTPTVPRPPSPTPVVRPDLVIHDVPFTVQAPRRQWDQDIYQYACEEASILMAMGWVIDRTEITADQAETELVNMAEFAEEYIGTFYDQSAADTARLFQAYYDYDQLELVDSVTKEDIIETVYTGNIALLPMNGQVLKNPNYTPPGPVEHMLVVIGYDATTDEFITNDPGISQGAGWRYDASLFEQAIQDYPTGHKEPILETHKRMIVVSKN